MTSDLPKPGDGAPEARDPQETQPSPPGSGTTPDPVTVLDEIRRQRAETSMGKAIVLRVLGLLVLGCAIWIVSKNVTWGDTLRVETGDSTVSIPGEILGDWRGESTEFQFVEGEELWPLADQVGRDVPGITELQEIARAEGSVRVSRDAIRLPGGRAALMATTDDAPSEEGSTRVDRIEWRPGMERTIGEIRPVRLLPALGFLILASLCVVTRWWRLLALTDCPTRWRDAFRYTYSGLFFNAVIPGINGGDVARAVAVVRVHPERRGEAFMTVVVDRAIGLIGMVTLGTACVMASDARLDALKLPVGLFGGAVIVGAVLFFNPSLRRILRFESVLERLPQGERVLRLDAHARRLVSQPREVVVALLFSFGNHVFNGLAVFAAALALGSELGFLDWLTTMAIANTLAAVPLSPGGLGVGEVLFGTLGEMLGASYALGVATSLVYRATLYGMSLLGGLVMLLPSRSQPGAPLAKRG